jgi:uncharacterized protein YprB with RNaseH-like and TPR domain
MDKQSILPFHDAPMPRSKRLGAVDRSLSKTFRPGKPLGPGITAALADPARVIFLDVETTGLSWYYDDITIVGWMRDGRYEVLVAGELPARLIDALQQAAALVTFNGTLFDLRFLRKAFA